MICTIIKMMCRHFSRESGLISVMGGARVGLSCRQSVTAPRATSPPDTYANSHQEPPYTYTRVHHQSTRYLCQEPPVVHQIFTPRATSPPQPSATGSGSPETKDKTPAIMRHKFPIQPPSIKRQQAITKFRLLIHKKSPGPKEKTPEPKDMTPAI